MGPPPPIITPLAPKAKPPAPVVVVVKAPPPVKPVVPAVPYDNTPKTAPWWSADGVTARETKPAWWSTPQVVAAGADVDAKVDAPGKAAWCDPKRPSVAQAL